MRFVYVPALIALAICAFAGCPQKEKPLIKLNNISITRKEFLDAYNISPFAAQGNAGFKDFLDQYITKKMILDEAERRGLDKDPRLLGAIQQYWEQELMKLTLSQVRFELPVAPVTDAQADNYYAQKGPDFFGGKAVHEVRAQIKDFLMKERQKQALQQWLDQLKQKTKVEIDYGNLGL